MKITSMDNVEKIVIDKSHMNCHMTFWNKLACLLGMKYGIDHIKFFGDLKGQIYWKEKKGKEC